MTLSPPSSYCVEGKNHVEVSFEDVKISKMTAQIPNVDVSDEPQNCATT